MSSTPAIPVPPTEGSVDWVVMRLLRWAARKERRLALVEYFHKRHREEATQQFRELFVAEGRAFHEIQLKTPAGLWSPEAPAKQLLGTLAALPADGIVSVGGFGEVLPKGAEALARTLYFFNFYRERFAAFPLHQVWWLRPENVALLDREIPDLASWFTVRLRLLPHCSEEEWSAEILTPQRRKELLKRAQALHDHAKELKNKGLYFAAEPERRECLEIRERVLGPEHPNTLISLNDLALLLESKGDLVAAEPLFRRALEAYEQVLGPEHPDTLISLNNLAYLLESKGDLAAAEPLFRRALEACERVLGPEHPNTLTSLNNLASLLETKGDLAAAEPLYRRALEARERVLGPEHPNTKIVRANLARLSKTESDEPLQTSRTP